MSSTKISSIQQSFQQVLTKEIKNNSQINQSLVGNQPTHQASSHLYNNHVAAKIATKIQDFIQCIFSNDSIDTHQQENIEIAIAIKLALPKLEHLLNNQSNKEIILHTNKQQQYQIFAVLNNSNRNSENLIEIRIRELEYTNFNQLIISNESLPIICLCIENLNRLAHGISNIMANCDTRTLYMVQQAQLELANSALTSAQEVFNTNPQQCAEHLIDAGDLLANTEHINNSKLAYEMAGERLVTHSNQYIKNYTIKNISSKPAKDLESQYDFYYQIGNNYIKIGNLYTKSGNMKKAAEAYQTAAEAYELAGQTYETHRALSRSNSNNPAKFEQLFKIYYHELKAYESYFKITNHEGNKETVAKYNVVLDKIKFFLLFKNSTAIPNTQPKSIVNNLNEDYLITLNQINNLQPENLILETPAQIAAKKVDESIKRLLLNIISPSSSLTSISISLHNVYSVLKKNFSALDEYEKSKLYKDVARIFTDYEISLTNKLSKNDNLIINKILKLLSPVSEQLQPNTHITGQVISRSFSSQYFSLIKQDRKARETVIIFKKIRNRLNQYGSDEHKLLFLNSITNKNVLKLLGKPECSTDSERLYILNERINLICETLGDPQKNTLQSSQPYSKCFRWKQWVSGHVGGEIISDSGNKFFSLYPDPNGVNRGGFLPRKPLIQLDTANDIASNAHNAFTNYALPFAGSTSNLDNSHQYFGIDELGVLSGIETFQKDYAQIHDRQKVYYQYYSNSHNCVGSIKSLLDFGLASLFTQEEMTDEFIHQITDFHYSLAYLYDIKNNINKINEKCNKLQNEFSYTPLTSEEISNHLSGYTNNFEQLPTDPTLKELIEVYIQAKQGKNRIGQLEILKNMVEKSFEQITNDTFCKDENNKLFIKDLLCEIQVVYANKDGTLLKLKDDKLIKLIKAKCPNEINTKSNLDKITSSYSYEIVTQALKELYTHYPKQLAQSLKSAYPDQLTLVVHTLYTTYCDQIDKLVQALKIIYPSQLNKIITTLIELYPNNYNEIIDILLNSAFPHQAQQVIQTLKDISRTPEQLKLVEYAIKVAYSDQPNQVLDELEILYSGNKESISRALQSILQSIYYDQPVIMMQLINSLVVKSDQVNQTTTSSTNQEQEFLSVLHLNHSNAPEQFALILKQQYQHTPDKIIPILHEEYRNSPTQFCQALQAIFPENSENVVSVLKLAYPNQLKEIISILAKVYEDNQEQFELAVDEIAPDYFQQYSDFEHPERAVLILKELYSTPTEVVDILQPLYCSDPEELGVILKTIYPNQPKTIVDILKNIYTPQESIKLALKNAFLPGHPNLFIHAVDYGFPRYQAEQIKREFNL